MESTQNFTRRLERLKAVNGWTDEELADSIGISRRMLYLMRTGKRPVSAKSLAKLEVAEERAADSTNSTRGITSFREEGVKYVLSHPSIDNIRAELDAIQAKSDSLAEDIKRLRRRIR